MQIEIDYVDGIESFDPVEQFGEWGVTHNISITGLKLVKKGSFSPTFEVDKSSSYYLVSALYSTGDSFGCETGIPHWIELFDSIEEATLFESHLNTYDELKRLKNDYYSSLTPSKKKQKIGNLTFKLLEFFDTFDSADTENYDGYSSYVVYKGVTYHFPWGGYFENLESVSVDTLTIS